MILSVRGATLALFWFLVETITVNNAANSEGPVVACMFQEWAREYTGDGQFQAKDVQPALCTHLLYMYGTIDDTTFKLQFRYDEARALGEVEALLGLRRSQPSLKVSIVLGGWDDGGTKYSKMVSNDVNRRIFINSAVEFLTAHQFDGIDIDWRDPGEKGRGGTDQDKQNFVALCRELKARLIPLSLRLGIFVSGRRLTIQHGYDVPELAKYADLLYVLAMEYHGPWETYTAHHTALNSRDVDAHTENKNKNVNFAISHLLALGAPANKLVLTIPYFGRTYTLSDPNQSGVGAPANDTGRLGSYSTLWGVLNYNEICEMLKSDPSWITNWDEELQAPYSVSGNQWVGYDNQRSIQLKTQVVKEKNLAGVAALSIDSDDFKGNCGEGSFPLLRLLNAKMGRIVVEPTTSTVVAPGEGCSVTVDDDVAVDVIQCGSSTHANVANFVSSLSSCDSASGRMPALSVVYVTCWHIPGVALRCHPDGLWRNHMAGSSPAGGLEPAAEGAMKELCQPTHVNSHVCGFGDRYKAKGNTFDSEYFFKDHNLHPWVVGLQVEQKYKCSATLITPYFVLTAGHCVTLSLETNSLTTHPADIKVQLKQDKRLIIRRVVSVTLHPNFKTGLRSVNDVALVRMTRPVRLNRQLYPACLDDGDKLNYWLTAVGFSRASGSNNYFYDRLLLDFDPFCFSGERCLEPLIVDKGQFCATDRTETMIGGSSGGPYAQRIGTGLSERWTVPGVLSSMRITESCNHLSRLIYTKVKDYYPWIEQVVNMDDGAPVTRSRERVAALRAPSR